MENKKIFWLENPKQLFNPEFVPKKAMTPIEILNVLSRDLIILLMVSILFETNNSITLLICSLIIFVVIMYLLIKDTQPIEKFEVPNFDTQLGNIDEIYDDAWNGATGTINGVEIDATEKCRIPTTDNPFMNYTMADIGIKNEDIQCDIKENIKDEIDKKFNEGLYKNPEDLFDTKNSQRQFYSIKFDAEGQDKLGKWLYNIPPTCKENTTMCNRYDDLRYSTRVNSVL